MKTILLVILAGLFLFFFGMEISEINNITKISGKDFFYYFIHPGDDFWHSVNTANYVYRSGIAALLNFTAFILTITRLFVSNKLLNRIHLVLAIVLLFWYIRYFYYLYKYGLDFFPDF